MMNRYNLRLKKGVLIGCDEFPELTSGNKHCPSFGILYKTDYTQTSLPFGFVPDSHLGQPVEKTTFTQQEIDNLPYGFVKLFDIIKVKEELYYIRLPYACDRILNEILHCGEVDFYGKTETNGFKTKFTMSEIEEKYPLLQSFAVKVEEIDNE